MDSEIVKKYLITKKEDIRALKIENRDIKIAPSRNVVNVVVGARRTGKTYAIYYLILKKLNLKDEQFLYMNLEDAQIEGINNSDILESVNIHNETYGTLPEYLFFDEIQNLEKWEKSIYTLFETKHYNIVLTGSSSKLLSKEISTELRGRAITEIVYPLSLGEMFEFKHLRFDIEKLSIHKENEIKFITKKYMTIGALPDIVIDESLAAKFYNDYINLVIFKDIVERFGIKNIFVIRFLINSLLESFSKKLSINSLYERLKNEKIRVSKKTLYSYLALLQDSFFSYPLKKFNFSIRRSELSMPKIYINDVGIVATLVDLNQNLGRVMENIVFIQLKRLQQTEPSLELYYFESSYEVDFIKKKGNKILQLIQVTYVNLASQIDKREINGLLTASEELKCDDLFIITWSFEASIKKDGKKIKCVPLWKWLLAV